MIRPRTPKDGITGAGTSLGGERASHVMHVGPCFQRLHRELPLQRAIEHLHRCGPRPVGELFAEALDSLNVDPVVLDLLLGWKRLNPELVRALGGDRFPRRLQVVPR
jgi:hypothetical protein